MAAIAATSAFLDTSVLLPGLIDLGPGAGPAQSILAAVAERRLARPRTAWHCCLEFYSVATRLPEEFRLAPEDALRLIEEEILARFEVHDLPAGARKPFLQSAARDRVIGGRVYDAHIGEIARLAAVSVLVTDNRAHFSALARQGVAVVSAKEFAGQIKA